jgi:hypothetical protein
MFSIETSSKHDALSRYYNFVIPISNLNTDIRYAKKKKKCNFFSDIIILLQKFLLDTIEIDQSIKQDRRVSISRVPF